MTMDRRQAGAQLAEIETIVARVKQSRIYRVAGDICIVWGVAHFARYLVITQAPAPARAHWYVVDVVAVALTLALLARGAAGRHLGAWKPAAALALFYGFGWIWSQLIGNFDGRQSAAFWPTLFLFGYSLAGLWFGVGFTALGLSLTALIVGGYVFAGAWLPLWLTLSTGGGFILCGLWMRRA